MASFPQHLIFYLIWKACDASRFPERATACSLLLSDSNIHQLGSVTQTVKFHLNNLAQHTSHGIPYPKPLQGSQS